jgi:adenylylsulfate kinase
VNNANFAEIFSRVQNIFPIHDSLLKQEDKEKLLQQRALVVWMVGLSGSGKSTLARALENTLYQEGYLTQILDGDNLRSGVNSNLGFGSADREENIRRAAEVARLFADCGVVAICSFISPTERLRAMARDIIGEDRYFEVFVNCPLEVCEQRDVKGLYARARRGEIPDFTGISAPFEEPAEAGLVLRTDLNTLPDCHDSLVTAVMNRIRYPN